MKASNRLTRGALAFAVLCAIATAPTAHAQVYGNQQRFNDKMNVCESIGDIAALNWTIRKTNGAPYDIWANTEPGGYRNMAMHVMANANPDHYPSADAARRAGFAYCIDNIGASFRE